MGGRRDYRAIASEWLSLPGHPQGSLWPFTDAQSATGPAHRDVEVQPIIDVANYQSHRGHHEHRRTQLRFRTDQRLAASLCVRSNGTSHKLVLQHRLYRSGGLFPCAKSEMNSVRNGWLALRRTPGRGQNNILTRIPSLRAAGGGGRGGASPPRRTRASSSRLQIKMSKSNGTRERRLDWRCPPRAGNGGNF